MKPKRILIIDDEESIRETTQTCLEMIGGWEAFTASSGHEGLVKAEAEQPDAILLDVMMPHMDGVTTFNKLQANPMTQHIPVILLTAKSQPSEQRQFAQIGVRAVISKPYDPLTLPDEMAAVLGW